jgi:hypothetical protein
MPSGGWLLAFTVLLGAGTASVFAADLLSRPTLRRATADVSVRD